MQACRAITGASVVGLLLIGVVVMRDAMAGSAYHSQQQQQIEAEKARIRAEQERVELAKELADTYRDNQIADVQQFIVTDYTLSDQPPVLDWNTSVDPTRKTFIFDKNRLCIGYAEGGQFSFVRTTPGACNQ
ncbi:MAG TPA: hypothetical protein V6D29_14260 [Leptolyngbyaceae cyanobacterium]